MALTCTVHYQIAVPGILVALKLIKMSTNDEDSSTKDVASVDSCRDKSIESSEKISQGKKDKFNSIVSESVPDLEASLAPESNVGEKSAQNEDGPSHHNINTPKPKNFAPEEAGQSHPALSSNATTSCRALELELDGQWVFLDIVHEFMKCRICRGVFESPQLLSCCGTNICKNCIARHLQQRTTLADQQPSCPFCRSMGYKLIYNAALEMSIDQLRVKCCYQHKGCSWVGILERGKLHLKECDFVPIDCPNGCGCEQFERHQLSDHMLICPHAHINCSFESIGCNTKMPLVRQAAQKHASDCLSEHLLLVAQKNVKLLKDYQKFHTSLQSEGCGDETKVHDELVKSQKEALGSTQQTIKSLKERLLETQQKTASLKAELESGEACLAELKNNVSQTKNTEDTCKESCAQIQTLPVPQAIGMSCIPFTFTIDNFLEKMAQNGKRLTLSPPFYTHFGGYKMCLSVHSDRNRGPITVSLHFLAGEFDEYLTWPFPGAIFTITAINKCINKFNKSINLELVGEDTIHSRGRQNLIHDNLNGFCAQDFLSHSDLADFLSRNNSLQLMLYRIQFLPL